MDVQPDFSAISQHFGLLSQQFAACQNLPVVRSNVEVLEALQALRTDVQESSLLLNTLVGRFDRMELRAAARLVFFFFFFLVCFFV